MQIDHRDSEEGQPAGQRSCQMLLSDPVMDTNVGAGSWPTLGLRSFSNRWDATRQASWFHSFVPGDVRVFIRMSEGLDYSTRPVSTA